MSWIDAQMENWLLDWDDDDSDLPSQQTRNAISNAVRQTIQRCAEIATFGRLYAEGDIRSVVAAIRALEDTNDPWGEETR